MGEQAKQLQDDNVEEKPCPEEQVKAEEKQEEKTEEKKEEETEGKKEEETEEAKPPEPFVLSVELHCMGCAKKIERSISKIRGVEGVMIDMGSNKVTIKGVVEPEAVCSRIMKKTKRAAKVVSPSAAAEGETMPQVVASQVSGLTTVELNVNMHCDACAHQLQRKILKMKGVRTAETDASSGKVTVTGSMDPEKLVDYVYRRTKKQAKIVPQAQEAAADEEKKQQGGGGEEEKAAAAEAHPAPEEEEKKKKEEGGGGGDDDAKKEEDGGGAAAGVPEQMSSPSPTTAVEEQIRMQKMMAYPQYYNQYYPAVYVMERIPPPPQLFSDENPNACCIT